MRADSDDRDAALLLAPLREVDPRALSTVSVAGAVRVGARRRHTRQLVGVIMVACVVALVVAAVPAVVSGRTMNQPAGSVGEFDPLRQEFRVGSAGGFTPVSYETGRYRQRVVLRLDSPDSPQATIRLYASGRVPVPQGVPASEVNGRRAVWVAGPDATVAWEWARDAWGFASVPAGMDEARDKAHRVAQSVEPGARVAVAVPFTVPPPGDAYQMLGVLTPYGTSRDPTDATLLVFGTSTDGDRILVGVQRDSARQPASGPSVTVPLEAGWSAVAIDPAQLLTPQRLAELAGSVRLR